MPENTPRFPKEFIEQVQAITNKRARIVIDHIIEHGFITTDALKDTYGYIHPPRAAMDVKDAGIPLESFKVTGKLGRPISAYRFGDLTKMLTERIAGRVAFSKKFKKELFEASNGHCSICNGKFEERYLQVDHRVPYEVAGDLSDREHKDFMLLCGSCNRAKSWSCEHCKNWKDIKDPSICMDCYWGSPSHYHHIALEQVRRLDIQWNGDEVQYYDAIKLIAEQHQIELPELIKQLIAANGKSDPE